MGILENDRVIQSKLRVCNLGLNRNLPSAKQIVEWAGWFDFKSFIMNSHSLQGGCLTLKTFKSDQVFFSGKP